MIDWMEKLSREVSYLSNILKDAQVRTSELRNCFEDTDGELRDRGEAKPSRMSLVHERMRQQGRYSTSIGEGAFGTLLVSLASSFSLPAGRPLKKENISMAKGD